MNGPRWEKVSDLAKDLVLRMLHLDPNRRITAKEIVIHPWLLSKTCIKPNAPSLNSLTKEKEPEEIKVMPIKLKTFNFHFLEIY